MSFSVWFRFQTRGAIFFLIGVVTLLLFDHDEKVGHMSDHESEPFFSFCCVELKCVFYLLGCQVRVTAGDSGLCCCVHVTECKLTPFVDFSFSVIDGSYKFGNDRL